MRKIERKPLLMALRVLVIVCGAMTILGFIFVSNTLGTYADSELDVGRAIMELVVGYVMCIAGVLGGIWFNSQIEERENHILNLDEIEKKEKD